MFCGIMKASKKDIMLFTDDELKIFNDDCAITYSVSFPQSIDNTIVYPTRCGKDCKHCRDDTKPFGFGMRNTKNILKDIIDQIDN